MTDLKTTQENQAAALGGGELVRIVQNALNAKDTIRDMAFFGRATNPVSAQGAKGDWAAGVGGSAAASSTSFSQTDFTFSANDNGKTIFINGAGANGGNLKTTISGANGSTCTLGAATSAAVGSPNAYLSGAAVNAAGTGVVPNDTFTLNNGTNAIAGLLTVVTTKIVSASINAAGSGGTNGTFDLVGTTGTGTLFVINVTIAGGALSAINSILAAGHYTVNPTSLSAEPVSGAGLTGATVTIVMGVDTVSITKPGSYSVQPSNPVTPSATSGAGTGVTFNLSFTTTGAWWYATDDTTAISNSGTPLYLEKGKLFFTSMNDTTATFLPKKTMGLGQILDVSGNKKGYFYSNISAAPSSFGSWGSPAAAFTGDLSGVQFPIQHIISGAATLGQPSTGYVYTEEAYPFLGHLNNLSGWNQNTGSNVGRTAACFARVRVFNQGQGDAVAYNATAFVTGAKASATSFLANPAVALFNGDVNAGQDGVYLNPFECILNDQGYDAAAIGYVVNMNRSNDRGNLGAVWFGFRSQNQGTAPGDAHFSAGGTAKMGIDLSGFTPIASGTWNNAAIVLGANMKIYFNATAPAQSPGYSSNPGTTYMQYSSGNTGIQAVVANTSTMLLTSSNSFLYNTVVLGTDQNNRLQVVGAANGSAPNISTTGTSDSNVDLKLSPKGSGNIQFNNAASFSANGTVATAMSSLGPTGSHATIQTWLTIKDNGGVVRYIPCF